MGSVCVYVAYMFILLSKSWFIMSSNLNDVYLPSILLSGTIRKYLAKKNIMFMIVNMQIGYILCNILYF